MELTWGKVISGGFALLCATALSVWNLRGDRIEELTEKNASYEQASKLNLPKSLVAMEKLSKSLEQRLATLSELEALKPKLDKAKSKIRTLSEEVETLNKTLMEKEAYIKELYLESGSLKIREGNTKHLGGHQVVIGVVNVNPSSHYAEILVNNEELKMSVGGRHPFSLNGKDCSLVLDNTYYSANHLIPYAELSYSCLKSEKTKPNTTG